MPEFQGPGLSGDATPEQMRDYIIRLERKLNFVLNTLESVNIREIGDWRVKPDQLVSKDGDVGMSTADTGGDDIRFWAGDAIDASPAFIVRKSGKMTATDGEFTGDITGSTITGGTVRSGEGDETRIELSGGKFTGYTASGEKTGLYFDINDVPNTGLADVHLYHLNSQLLTFYDNITNIQIMPGANASSMILGKSGKSVSAQGTWTFAGGYTGSFQVVTGVNFTSQTVTTKTVTVSGGIVTSVS